MIYSKLHTHPLLAIICNETKQCYNYEQEQRLEVMIAGMEPTNGVVNNLVSAVPSQEVSPKMCCNSIVSVNNPKCAATIIVSVIKVGSMASMKSCNFCH